MVAYWLCVLMPVAAVEPVDLSAVRTHLARGRYDEAAEWFENRKTEELAQPDVARWHARWQSTTGNVDAAIKTLNTAIENHPGDAALHAELGRLLHGIGKLDAARQAAEAALAIDRDHPLARLVQADVWTATGQLQQASDAYRWFVRYYNQAQPDDAETLVTIGQGAAQYARWRGVSQIFDFLVNTVTADALKSDPNCWQAHHLAGDLLLEKYNRADGIPELQAGLAINPRAPEIHVTLADAALEELQFDTALEHAEKALAVNPQHPAALRLKAKAYVMQGELAHADRAVKAARAACPTDQRIFALAAFVEIQRGDNVTTDRLQELFSQLDAIENWQPGDSPFEQTVVELAKINPAPGYFLQDLGRLYQGQRKLSHAEVCYRQAIRQMPQLSQPKSELGMLLFQSGRMDEAQRLLDDAFKADPYHVRISNMRKVLRVLEGYATVTTPHFVIRADSQLDGVLAKYMAEELERVYADVTAEYGFEPPQRTQIEIYNKARGLAGHQWFSARMIGLPWLQTIGASTGLIIALTSPAATQEPYNWARVIRHEFVHVVTLQQTDFNIPHWFTEALAVRAEGYPKPKEWDALLVKRFKAKNLKNLDNLHLGFQRAESREDWDFAYCQSVLYAEFFIERFGDDALPKLLNAYRETRSTDIALQAAFGAKKVDVEAGYLKFLARRVAEIQTADGEPKFDEAEISERYAADSESLANRGDYAWLLLRQRKRDEAEAIATDVLKTDPTQVRAATVLAQIRIAQDRSQDAVTALTAAYNTDRPDHLVWLLLGQLHLKSGKSDAAKALFQKAVEVWPRDPVWWRGLAQAAEQAGDRKLWIASLETLSRLDADSVAARLKRAELALEDADFAAAVDYAKQALQIDVLNVDIHLALARGFVGLKDDQAALAEYDIARELQPGSETIRQERSAVSQRLTP